MRPPEPTSSKIAEKRSKPCQKEMAIVHVTIPGHVTIFRYIKYGIESAMPAHFRFARYPRCQYSLQGCLVLLLLRTPIDRRWINVVLQGEI
jgi:hypothetical protein